MFNSLIRMQKDATLCFRTRLGMASPVAYARAPPFSTAGQSFTQSEFAPSRGRGLKLRARRQPIVRLAVRPLTGARIETQSTTTAPRRRPRSPPHGGAD